MKKQTTCEPRLRISPVSAKRAFESVEAQIRGLIASGSLQPGDRLPEEGQLAETLNVGRGSVREAFRVLEASGLVELRRGPGGGAFVSPGRSGAISNGLVNLYHLGVVGPDDLTEVRISIMDLVVRLACERISEDQIVELESNIDATNQAYLNEDFAAIVGLTSQFHLLLAKSTRNPILLANVEGLQEIVRLFLLAIGPVEIVNVVPSRRRFLRHLRNRDPEAASTEMARMLKRVKKSYFRQWDSRVSPQLMEASWHRDLPRKTKKVSAKICRPLKNS